MLGSAAAPRTWVGGPVVARVHVGRWACDSPHGGRWVGGPVTGPTKGERQVCGSRHGRPYDSDYKGGPVGLSQVCDSPHGRGLVAL